MTSEYMHTYDASLGKIFNNNKKKRSSFFIALWFTSHQKNLVLFLCRDMSLFFLYIMNLVNVKSQATGLPVCITFFFSSFFFDKIICAVYQFFVCLSKCKWTAGTQNYSFILRFYYIFPFNVVADFVITNWYLTFWPFSWKVNETNSARKWKTRKKTKQKKHTHTTREVNGLFRAGYLELHIERINFQLPCTVHSGTE